MHVKIQFQIGILSFLSYMVAAAMASDGVTKESQDRAVRERRLTALVAAGIDPKSDDALIAGLDNENVAVQAGAVFLIAERDVRSAIPALEIKLKKVNTFIGIRICEVLAALGGDKQIWTQYCENLLRDENDATNLKLQAASLLAKHGNAKGWTLVRSSLDSDDVSIVEESIRVLASFSLCDSQSLLIAEYSEIFSSADELHQSQIVGELRNFLATKQLPMLDDFVKHAKSENVKSQLVTLMNELRRKAPN